MADGNVNNYNIIEKDCTGEYEEKKSRFICYLHYAENEEDAISFINSIKKKHYDARHNCHAMILGPKRDFMRSSDDGEPQGTAGKPMLEVLNGAGLTNIVCVVTRYFGGVLLGTGGLLRAYTQAVKDALSNANILSVEHCRDLKVTISYPLQGTLEHYLRSNEIKILSTDYTENVSYTVRLPYEKASSFTKDITDLSKASAAIEDLGEGFFPL